MEPLKNCTELTTLNLDNNLITDLSPLSALTKLETLTADNNKITNIEGLGKLEARPPLSLSDNEIEDVSSLVGLKKKLTTLDMSANKIKGIAVLKDAFADGTITTITLKDNADIPYEDWDVLSEDYPKATITGKPSSKPEELRRRKR